MGILRLPGGRGYRPMVYPRKVLPTPKVTVAPSNTYHCHEMSRRSHTNSMKAIPATTPGGSTSLAIDGKIVTSGTREVASSLAIFAERP